MTLAKLTSVIATVDVPNKNGHIYTTESIQRVIANAPQPIYGTMGMPLGSPTTIAMADVSHMVENLRINERGEFIGDITILNTPKGQMLKDIMSITPLDFRTCGVGDVQPNGEVDNFQLSSINAVADGA